MLLGWLLFPAVLLLVSAGLGLGIARITGGLPRGLLLPVGFAAAIVIASLLTASAGTASAASPTVLALAVAGTLAGRDRRASLPDRWAVLAGVGVFLVFAAPALLSGQGTFAGFIRLDDTATWWALADQALDNGRQIPSSMADPSTYSRVLEDYVPAGYPFGAFLPLGLAHELSFGEDLAFGFQPTLALLAGLLAMTLTEIARPLVASPRARALVGFVAAQGTLLFSYAQWGAIKELTGALLVALVAATAQILRRPEPEPVAAGVAEATGDAAAPAALPKNKSAARREAAAQEKAARAAAVAQAKRRSAGAKVNESVTKAGGAKAGAAKANPAKGGAKPNLAKGGGAKAGSAKANLAKGAAAGSAKAPAKPASALGSSGGAAVATAVNPPWYEVVFGTDEEATLAGSLQSARRAVPLAIAGAAVAAALSVGGAVWALPIAALSLLGSRPGLLRMGVAIPVAIALAAVLSIPSLKLYDTFVKPLSMSNSVLRVDTELGNLIKPLKVDQGMGIWLSGDFRVSPDSMTVTTILLVVLGIAALGGIGVAVFKRGGAAFGYALGGGIACLYLTSKGSPWVDGKALATASPMLLTAALTGVAVAWGSKHDELKAIALALGGVLALGVLWSNALVYGQSFVAPRDQLVDLQKIGDMLKGEGPTLMNEYEPYGARHFLRDADAEGASERRVRPIPVRDGTQLPKSAAADVTSFDPTALRDYRSLVIRRDPLGSRPPSDYDLRWTGKAYSVWQRSSGDPPAPATADMPLGDLNDPAAVPDCTAVRTLAQQAGADGRLLYVPRLPVVTAGLSTGPVPDGWVATGDTRVVLPKSDGAIAIPVTVPRAGKYRVWVGGSSHGTTSVSIDDRSAGSIRGILNNQGGSLELGTLDLTAGQHLAQLTYKQGFLRPGSRGQDVSPLALGPLVIAPASESLAVQSIPTTQAAKLCGQRLDWIEARAAGN